MANIEKLEITKEKKQELKERFTIFEGDQTKGFYKRMVDIEYKHNKNITFLNFLDNEIAKASELLPQKEKSEKSKLDEGEKFVIIVNGYRAIVFDKSNHEISTQDGKLLIGGKSAGKYGKQEVLASIPLSDVNFISIIEEENKEYKSFNRNKKYLYAVAVVIGITGLSGYITGIVKDNIAVALPSIYGAILLIALLFFATHKMEEKCFKEHGLSVSKDKEGNIDLEPITNFINAEEKDRERNKDKKEEFTEKEQIPLLPTEANTREELETSVDVGFNEHSRNRLDLSKDINTNQSVNKKQQPLTFEYENGIEGLLSHAQESTLGSIVSNTKDTVVKTAFATQDKTFAPVRQ